MTLDLEGVLAPEIWIATAEATGVDAFLRTTRDEPDYELLMKGRLQALADNDISFSQLIEIVETLEPLKGAVEFINRLQTVFPIVILSDTFEQLAAPMFAKLGSPLVLCHRLTIEDDRVTGAAVRRFNAKQHAVEAFHSLGYKVIGVGDSFNDLTMLRSADRAVLFRPSELVRSQNSDLRCTSDYAELFEMIVNP